MNELLAKKLLPLVNNPQTWEPLKEFLQDHHQLINRGLAVEQSELEMRRLQGKAILLETLEKLPDVVRSSIQNAELERERK
jgi:hypothetical protein